MYRYGNSLLFEIRGAVLSTVLQIISQYIVGTQKNRLIETVLLGARNFC